MTRRKSSGIVSLEGTVSPSDNGNAWGGVVLVTRKGDDLAIIPDEMGRDMASHLFEEVHVDGRIRRGEGGLRMLRVLDYVITSHNVDHDADWFVELDDPRFSPAYGSDDFDDDRSPLS